MSILNQLSSQTGDRTEYSNRKVVIQCLENRDLLSEVADGLKHQEAALLGDCAEVMTKVAEDHPEWVVPYAGVLTGLISHPNTRVRWEAMHALSLVAPFTPATIAAALPQLVEILRHDHSVIVRDHATDAIAGYASTSASAAQAAYPILKDMLTLWDGKQAGHALQGMLNISRLIPALHPELRLIAIENMQSKRGVVRKAAKSLLNATTSKD